MSTESARGREGSRCTLFVGCSRGAAAVDTNGLLVKIAVYSVVCLADEIAAQGSVNSVVNDYEGNCDNRFLTFLSSSYSERE